MPELEHITHGVWRPQGSIRTDVDRYALFLSVLPAGTLLGGLTAAELHGLWLPTKPDSSKPEFVLASGLRRPRDHAATARREVHSRRRGIEASDRALVDGLPVLSVARTWVDLAEVLSLPDLVAAGDSALRLGAEMAGLQDATKAARGRRGVVRARQALDLLDPRSRSRPESHLRVALVVGGLPRPEVNVAIHNEVGEWIAEPDLVYKRARLTIEYNGSEHAQPKRMRRDITRSLDVDGSGWYEVVFGPAEVFNRPDWVATYIRALLDERDPGWRRRDRPEKPRRSSGGK